MRGSSRDSLAGGQERLAALLAARGTRAAGAVDAAAVGDELLAVTGLLAGSAALRRALSDPSRPAEAKTALVHRLLDGKVSDGTLEVLDTVAGGRWGSAADLVEAVEQLGVEALLAAAEKNGRLDATEDELFRFARTIEGDPGLRDAFSGRTEGTERKAELVHRLLDGRAGAESVRLAVQAAVAPRGMRTEQVLERFVDAAAQRREQLIAQVAVAAPLSEQQHDRLVAALRRIYEADIRLNVDVVPHVLGGLQIKVRGELLDGTVLGRLEAARRRLAG